MTEDSRAFVKELAQMECQLVRSLVDGSLKLSSQDESVLRWALSLARVSRVLDPKPVEIGHSTDDYRTKLYEILKKFQKHTSYLGFAIFRTPRAFIAL